MRYIVNNIIKTQQIKKKKTNGGDATEPTYLHRGTHVGHQTDIQTSLMRSSKPSLFRHLWTYSLKSLHFAPTLPTCIPLKINRTRTRACTA